MTVQEVFELIPFRLVASAGIAATLAGILLHYLVFGPHRLSKEDAGAKKLVRRMSIWERLIHAIALMSFCTLGVTGMVAVIGYGSRVSGWLWFLHALAAPVFCASLVGVVVMWARDGCFAAYDAKWMLYMGGYVGIGKHKRLPAGRFNAGQKAYLWIIAALGLAIVLSGLARLFPALGEPWNTYAYFTHQYSTLLGIMAVIGHAYLGSLANPETLSVALTGRVSPAWAARHHPVWWEEVNKGQG
ncbi:MAG TPA: hypothetical protein ENN80_10475 [Candidatus Hydrogenedentes bacterium]|nr:hypothetical protein [Candidatus Hydrogenedentota bacterium]